MPSAGFTDRIGDRLDHPERVPPEYRHLIPDDQQRIKRILEFPVHGLIYDVGCSDGAITRRIRDRWQVRVHGVDPGCHVQVGFPVWDRLPLYGSPDTIYLTEILEHLTPEQSRVMIRDCTRFCDDLIITVPNRSPHYDYVKQGRSRWAWPDHRQEFTQSSLRRLLAPFTLLWRPLYDNEDPSESIFLIVRAHR